MAGTPNAAHGTGLPSSIGSTAIRQLSLHGLTSLELVAQHSTYDLQAIHGVGPKAIRILRQALGDVGQRFPDDESRGDS